MRKAKLNHNTNAREDIRHRIYVMDELGKKCENYEKE
jgi:hypothetical protein